MSTYTYMIHTTYLPLCIFIIGFPLPPACGPQHPTAAIIRRFANFLSRFPRHPTATLVSVTKMTICCLLTVSCILFAFRFENGVLHGFSKLFDRNQTLLAVGWYENGKLSGLHWRFLVGGGCLIGEADHFCQMSGSNVTFLFPDHTTALTGTFSKSEMFLGQVSFIQVGHS